MFPRDKAAWTNDLTANAEHASELLNKEHEGFCIQEERGLRLSREAVEQYHELMHALYPEKSRFEL